MIFFRNLHLLLGYNSGKVHYTPSINIFISNVAWPKEIYNNKSRKYNAQQNCKYACIRNICLFTLDHLDVRFLYFPFFVFNQWYKNEMYVVHSRGVDSYGLYVTLLSFIIRRPLIPTRWMISSLTSLSVFCIT